MIMFFVYKLNLFPSGGILSTPPPTGFMYYLDILYHMALPVLTMILLRAWGGAYLIREYCSGYLTGGLYHVCPGQGYSGK